VKYKYKLGVVITRAQPVHLAHLEYVRSMCESCERILVIIGSSNESGKKRHPFTAEDREAMVTEAIAEMFPDDLERIMIRLLPDQTTANNDDNPLWGQYVCDHVLEWTGETEFTYFTGESLEQAQKWFGDKIGTRVTLVLERFPHLPSDLSATNVREAIIRGDWDWLSVRVPGSVLKRYWKLQRILLLIYGRDDT